MHGVVDRVVKHKIFGWIAGKGVSECRVELRQDGNSVTESVPSIERKDLGSFDHVRGFCVEAPDGFALKDLTNGVVDLYATTQSDEALLTLWKPVELASKMEALPMPLVGRAIDLLPRNVRDNYQAALAHKNAQAHPVGYGSVSADEVAIIGRQGHIFLYKGSNNVVDIYKIDEEKSNNISSSWIKLLKNRIDNSKRFNSQFIQLIIPEKSSVLHPLCPYESSNGSKIYSDIKGKILSDESINSEFVDLEEVFQKDISPQALYRLEDSHFSTHGCQVVTETVMKSGGEPSLLRATSRLWVDREGDLGTRFPERIHSIERVPVFSGLSDNSGKTLTPELVDSYNPAFGHQGIMRSWRCADAPDQRRVLCFGNSFFERGHFSTALSWWFSRMFQEFKFVWNPNVDWDQVENYRPDLLIGQTIERFLERCPDA